MNGPLRYIQVHCVSTTGSDRYYYYQLTVSDEFWLKNGRDYGQYYLGIDGKYDLNIDQAPVLSIIVENKTKHATPLAFGKTGCNRLIIITK